MDEKRIIHEIQKSDILHWNFRDFEVFPEDIQYYGKHLQDIYLKGNKINIIPEWITELGNLVELHISGNQLRELPEKISTLKSLKKLDISENQITKLPETITSLINLDYFSAAGNQLTHLPNDIGKLKSLAFLYVNQNKIKYIPNAIVDCVSLQELDLQSNEVVCLPPGMVYLQNLEFMSLRSNKLHYLPAVPFGTQPGILIGKNKYLTYVCYDLALSMYSRHDEQWLEFNHWNHNQEQISRSLSQLRLRDHTTIKSETGSVLLFPLREIYQESETNITPTLHELTLRKVFNLYCHSMNSRKTRKILNLLPKTIQKEVLNGPAAICHHCRICLFKYAFVKLYQIQLLNNNHSQKLISLYFCSTVCASSLLDSKQLPLEMRLINWEYLYSIFIPET